MVSSATGCKGPWWCSLDMTYQSLQGTDEQLLKGLAGLVAVADILEGLCRILAGDVKHDLLATTTCAQCR